MDSSHSANYYRVFCGLRRLAALLGIFIIVTFVAIFAACLKAKSRQPEPGNRTLVVLGCGLRGREVSLTLKQRLDTAAGYYFETGSGVIVVSGGQGHDELIPEALAMRDYLVSIGVSAYDIIMEDKSENTRENFQFSKAVLDEYYGGDYNAVFVTSDFHILRASLYAKAAGLDVKPLASPSVSYLLPQSYLREYLALMRYYILEYWNL